MRIGHHVMVSTAGGAIIYLLTRSLFKALIFTIPGIFIDLDHLFDYVSNHGWKIVSYREFTDIFYSRRLNKVYVFFHGYELLVILGLLLWYFRVEWGWILFLTLSIHLVMDQIYFYFHFKYKIPWFYFITYRISKRFRADSFPGYK